MKKESIKPKLPIIFLLIHTLIVWYLLVCWVFNWLALTIEKGRVNDTSTDGEGQPQLPNRLKQLSHDSNLQEKKSGQEVETVSVNNVSVCDSRWRVQLNPFVHTALSLGLERSDAKAYLAY